MVKDILCLKKMPFVMLKSNEMEAFVMVYHVYKETWKLFVGEKLDTTMQPSNVKNKYAVTFFQEGKKKVIVHLPLGKSGRFPKTIFYFLTVAKENRYQIIVHGKAVNQNDGLGMKVTSRLLFTAKKKKRKKVHRYSQKRLPQLL